MVAHMNAEALARTIESGKAWYYSRSASRAVAQRRELRPPATRYRTAHRLRPGRRVDQGRAGGRGRLPHRAPLMLLSRGAARQGAGWLAHARICRGGAAFDPAKVYGGKGE